MPSARASTPEIVLVFSPDAGSVQEKKIRDVLKKHFADRQVELCETSREDNLTERLKPFLELGVHMVIAAGGDGTVSGVASALVNSDVPLGILPLGTGNVLAREVDLPLNVDEAAAILAGPFGIRRLDVLRVGDRVYTLAISVGISAKTMDETHSKQKKRFGRAAYWWNGMRNLFGFPRHTYLVDVDGRQLSLNGNDLVIVNSSILSIRALRWGPQVQPDDGEMNLFVVRPRSILDFIRILWEMVTGQGHQSSYMEEVRARKSIRIREPQGMVVQADGDAIGHTPLEIEILPSALKVVVPG